MKDVARIVRVSRKTVWKWHRRVSKKGRPNYRDLSRRPHRRYPKVNPYIENQNLSRASTRLHKDLLDSVLAIE